MRFSAVLGNYNGERYLEEAVRSVLNQKFEDYEFLAIDDGSTDSSIKILRRLEDELSDRMRVIQCEQNRGQCQAFNVGIREAKGDYICFLDSDDIWFPEKLNRIDEYLLQHPEAVLHQHQLLLLRDGEVTESLYRPFMLSGDLAAYSRTSKRPPFFVPTSGLTIERKAAQRCLPIPGSFRTCADGFLTRAAMCEGEVIAQTEKLGAYRVHEGNNTFENAKFNELKYISRVLIPELNAYYKRQGIDIELKLPPLHQRLYRFYTPSKLQKILDKTRKAL